MPPVTSGRKEKGECVLSRWVIALHVSSNLLNCSLTLSFDSYKKSCKESLAEHRPYLCTALNRTRCVLLLSPGLHLFHDKIWHEQIILSYKWFMEHNFWSFNFFYSISLFSFLDFLQFVFKTMACKERTIHEELTKSVTGLLKSNDTTTVKHVLKVKTSKTALSLSVWGSHWQPLEGDRLHRFL